LTSDDLPAPEGAVTMKRSPFIEREEASGKREG
jgi:hypothetical protein